MEFIEIIIEVVLGVLLLYAVFIGTKISKNFSDLKKGEREMRSLFVNFKDVIERAEKTMAQLKEDAHHSHDGLFKLFKDADQLRSDLEYMLDKSKGTVDRLEKTMRLAIQTEKRLGDIEITSPGSKPKSHHDDSHNSVIQLTKDHMIEQNKIKKQAFTPPPSSPIINKPKSNNKLNLLKAIEGMR